MGREETKVRDDRQAQERSNSTIGRSREDEAGAAGEANQVDVSLASYLAQMPDHPLAREIQTWIASLGKTLDVVSWWEMHGGQLALHTWKVCVSLKFVGSPSTHSDVFVYTDIEYLKGLDNGRYQENREVSRQVE